jgi:hypothetical protein
MAQLRVWKENDPAAAASTVARLRYKPMAGEHHLMPPGASGDDAIILPVGVQMIFDFGCFWEGELSFTPKFDTSRMVLRGTPVPPFSGDSNYTGGIRLGVMIQQQGLAELCATQGTIINVLDLLHDNFVRAHEAEHGKLPIYRVEEPRSFTIATGTMLYAPVYTLIGWTARDGLKLGTRLIPPPRPRSGSNGVTAPQALDSDRAFDEAARSGEVMPPKPKPATRRSVELVSAGDLDDQIPF